MHIAFVLRTLLPGGAERQGTLLCSDWREQGHDVTLITLSDLEAHYSLAPGVARHVVRDGTERGLVKYLKDISGLRAAFRRFQPDVIVSFMELVNFKALLAVWGLGIPIIISERTAVLEQDVVRSLGARLFYRTARRLLYPRAAALVVQTQENARWAAAAHVNKIVRVIPNILKQRTPSAVPRQNIILSVGRLTEEKGHDVLVEAFIAIAARAPDWQLHIVGDGTDRAALERQVAAASLSDRVVFKGVSTAPDAEYATAGIFVLPSRFEGFPNVLLEALADGCCVLSADGAAMREVIANGMDGMLFRTGDAASLANMLLTLIADAGLRQRLSQAAPGKAAQYFPDTVLPLWDALLQNVARTTGLSEGGGGLKPGAQPSQDHGQV